MSKLFLRRLLSPKLLAMASAGVLLLSLLPLSSQALTVDELLGQSGANANGSVYPSVTITSQTNTSLLLKVTPVSFVNGTWNYQITWHRTLNAQGSVYTTLKSDKSQQIYSQSPASQNDDGNQYMTLAPSTAYRIEFWQQPGKSGSLLLRKFFTTLPATTANSGTSGSSGNNGTTGTTGALDTSNPNGPSQCFTDKDFNLHHIGQSITCVDYSDAFYYASQTSSYFGKIPVPAKGSYQGSYDGYQYYCGTANYHTPGTASGSVNGAFLNPPPTDSLCANGATPSAVGLNLDLPYSASNNQGDVGTPGPVHWHWSCTGAARPDKATSWVPTGTYPANSTQAGQQYNAAGFAKDFYDNSFDNRNGTYSQCAAPVYMVDSKYCGADNYQHLTGAIPTQGLCSNGAKAGTINSNAGAYDGYAGETGVSWTCAGSDYVSYCRAVFIGSNGGQSSTASAPTPVCAYDPVSHGDKCLFKTTCDSTGDNCIQSPISSTN